MQPTSSDDVPYLQLYSQMDFTLIKFYLVPYAPLRLYLAVNRERVQISKTLYVFICAIVTRHWSWLVMNIQVINCKTVPHEGDIITRKSNSKTISWRWSPINLINPPADIWIRATVCSGHQRGKSSSNDTIWCGNSLVEFDEYLFLFQCNIQFPKPHGLTTMH